MIIAHGPLGYIITEITRHWWQVSHFSKSQIRWCVVAGFIGGMFPDIDLFFYYFIDASQSHRQLLTHSVIFYLAICVVGLAIRRWTRNRTKYAYVAAVITVFSLGAISHIVTDMIVGQVILLAPFTYELFGLVNTQWFRDSLFMRYSHVTGFGIELIVLATAIYLWIRRHQPSWLKRFYYGATISLMLGLVMLWYMNEHVYKPNGYFYYADQDADGIVNAEDLDIDGDSVINIKDTDIDNDGEDNSLDFYRETFSMKGSLYDFTQGKILEVPMRFGFVNEGKLVERSYANVGVFFSREMAEDYSINQTGYEFTPADNEFSSSLHNWQVWFQHQKKLLPASTQLNEFDILFFKSGHVGLLTRIDEVDYVLEADTSHFLTTETPLTEVEQREGDIIAVGRILPKPKSKQY